MARKKLDAEQEWDAIEIYQSGASLREVGRSYGVSQVCVLSLLKRHGLHRRPGWVALKDARPDNIGPRDAARYAAMAEARSAGMTLAEIGKHFGLSKQRVHQVLRPAAKALEKG